jgi:hypothetical protein
VDFGYHETFGREGEEFGENMNTQEDFFFDKLNEITEIRRFSGSAGICLL